MYRRYHDLEWGRPSSDERRLFEKLSLEGFMSGLSWLTILRKRENFRAAFLQFAPESIARFGSRDVARLMGDASIVRNRAKIEATINNAQRYAELVKEFGTMGGLRLGLRTQTAQAPARSRGSAGCRGAGRGRRDEQRSSAPRLGVRGSDYGPFVHASHRSGQRPHSRVRRGDRGRAAAPRVHPAELIFPALGMYGGWCPPRSSKPFAGRC